MIKNIDNKTINFPPLKKLEETKEVFFNLHRLIEKQYRDLPWPPEMKNIVVLTQVCGGRGDIVAAAKAIALVQEICPTLSFDWILQGISINKYKPKSFLNCKDPSKVHVRGWQSKSLENKPGDLLFTGPVKLSWDAHYIGCRINRKIEGPNFKFLENAEELCYIGCGYLRGILKKTDLDKIYKKLHSKIFRSEAFEGSGILSMGLRKYSGVFLDKSRVDAPLSRKYCCPNYLLKIQDSSLRKDILKTMNVLDDKSKPDYDQFAFNFGYAHRPKSWEKFIDCVAIHEKKKDVVIVLNQRGLIQEATFYDFSTKEFREKIFTEKRLSFLRKKGFGNVVLKGEGEKFIISNTKTLKLVLLKLGVVGAYFIYMRM
jgi:hypothetical protein